MRDKQQIVNPKSWTVRHETLPRGTLDVVCEKCGGMAMNVPGTDQERCEFGCGRPFDCCNVAFVCSACGLRMVGRRAAPEME